MAGATPLPGISVKNRVFRGAEACCCAEPRACRLPRWKRSSGTQYQRAVVDSRAIARQLLLSLTVVKLLTCMQMRSISVTRWGVRACRVSAEIKTLSHANSMLGLQLAHMLRRTVNRAVPMRRPGRTLHGCAGQVPD